MYVLNLIKKKLMLIKFYITRSQSYLSMINAGAILIILLKQFNVSVTEVAPIIAIIGLVMLAVLGYIETKKGFYSEEIKISSYKNPVIVFNLKRLDELEDKQDMILKKLDIKYTERQKGDVFDRIKG